MRETASQINQVISIEHKREDDEYSANNTNPHIQNRESITEGTQRVHCEDSSFVRKEY